MVRKPSNIQIWIPSNSENKFKWINCILLNRGYRSHKIEAALKASTFI